jgi:hypothetical protein
VLAFAPRISPRLLVALDWIDDHSLPIAEVNRRLGEEAARLGLPRPSYQRVRELVHKLRWMKRQTTTVGVLWDVALRARPPEALLDHISGVGVSKRPP